ncbi:MAG: helix-turn-helix domain-containing protein [Actinobacteria bacterium]|nr:helix-turn-helix domain-containing protein [Actinomycetota bacterium]
MSDEENQPPDEDEDTRRHRDPVRLRDKIKIAIAGDPTGRAKIDALRWKPPDDRRALETWRPGTGPVESDLEAREAKRLERLADAVLGPVHGPTVADSDLGTTFTLRDLAARLGRSVKTVRRMVTAGTFPEARQVPMPDGKGRRWEVPYSDVIAWERAQETGSALAAPPIRAQAPPDETAAALAEALRERDQARQDARTAQTLADERAATIEALTGAIDALRLALPAAPVERRRWWQRRA